MKAKANVNAYLLLMQEDKLLCYLRQNTGWQDGTWGLVAEGKKKGNLSLIQ